MDDARGGAAASDVEDVLAPFHPTSVALVRAHLLAWMGARGFGQQQSRDDAALVLSELLSNAIRHGNPLKPAHVRAHWHLGNRYIEIAVTDGGGASEPHVASADEHATAGRGMYIVEQLATSWWRTSDGKASTVHALVSL